MTNPATANGSRRLRSLHVTASLDPVHGGDARATADLCAALTALGEHCELATLTPAVRAGSGGFAPEAVRRLSFRASPPRRLGNSLPLARWLMAHARDYDLIEIHGIFRGTSLIAAACAQLARVPSIVHPHGSLDPFDLRKHRNAKRILGPLFRMLLLDHARAILFTGTTEMTHADTFGAATPRYEIPPVILDDAAGDRTRFRRHLGVAETTFVLLFMSRIDYKKGLPRTLRALATLVERGVDVLLVIAGSGDAEYEAIVIREIDRLHLWKHVRFIGFVTGPRKADALAGADALVLVSDNENFGVVVLEALRAGLPVVLSDQVAIAATLAASSAAITVRPDDVATADAVEKLITDTGLRRRMADCGRRAAASLYDWRAVGAKQHRLRQRIVAAHAEGSR